MSRVIHTQLETEVCFPARISFTIDADNHGEITHIQFPAPFPKLTYEQRQQVLAEMNAEIQRIRSELANPTP